MKTNLFGKRITPACEYCERGSLIAERQLVICAKNGSKQPYDSCNSFDYSPLKRTPTRIAPLPSFNKKEFEL